MASKYKYSRSGLSELSYSRSNPPKRQELDLGGAVQLCSMSRWLDAQQLVN
jgi:hypothetical protein